MFVQGHQFGQALACLRVGDLLIGNKASQIREQLLVEIGPVSGARIGTGARVSPEVGHAPMHHQDQVVGG